MDMENQLRMCYLNCFLPSNDLLEKSLSKHIGCEGKVISRDNNVIMVKLKNVHGYNIYKFTLRKGVNERLYVNSISLDDIVE